MCCPIQAQCGANILSYFKSMDWIFKIWFIWIVINLIRPRYFFEAAVKFTNWLICIHDLGGSIVGTEKGFKRFSRDLWIILVLLGILIVLIRYI